MKVEAVKEHLHQILSSSHFKQADIYSHLLSYLVKTYLNGEQVKESILEVELFENFSPQVNYEGKIRVYMFNLRKKLDEYYRTEGLGEKLRFVIDKGQYNLRIDEKKGKSAFFGMKWKFIVSIAAISLISVYILLLKKEKKYCWDIFFESPYKTTFVIGDHYLLRGQTDKGLTYSTHFDGIYNDSSRDSILKHYNIDAKQYYRPTAHFITKMGPVAATRLAQWFTKHDIDFETGIESEIPLTELNKINIVYIGPYKTLTNLRNVFLSRSDSFYFDNNTLNYSVSKKQIPDQIINNTRYDHVMVSLQKLSDNGNMILFFAGNHDIGVISTVKNFTDKTWLKNFYHKNKLNYNTCFNALFVVKGIGRTDLSCELVRLEAVE